MKRVALGLMAALLLASPSVRADHHEVFVHSAIKLDSRSCAVELEIFANSQNGFEGVDRIAVDGATLASLGDSVAGTIDAGGHTNAGDRILFASANFQLETGVAPDVIFDDGKCGIFAPNSVFTFVIDDISFGGANTIIDTLTADASFGVNLTAMTKASSTAAAQFVDLNAATLTVKNNAGVSAGVGGGGGGGCGLAPVKNNLWTFGGLLPLLSTLFLLSVKSRRSGALGKILPASLFVFFLLLPAVHAGQNLAQLLTSSPWCSFSYNKITGYSHTKRYIFRSNGTYSVGSRGEGYSSGGGGTFASQRDGSAGGQWKVTGDTFYMSEGGEVEQVDYRIKSNSNGSPIVVADGVEYSQCN